MLAVVAKDKKSQLLFFDELREFDPKQQDSVPNDLQSCPNLLSSELQKLLHTSGEWQPHWKQQVIDSPECDLLNGGEMQVLSWVC